MTPGETDADLVLRAQAGDRAAFAVLVGRHQARVLASCLRLSGNLPDAEDLAHDALVQAWLELPRLRDPARFAGWLKTLTLNVFRMWYRRRRRDEVEVPEDLPAPEPAPERGWLERSLSQALFRIPSAHRVALVLHHLEGLSTAEVAGILGVPVGTVLSRLHRGRKALEEQVRGAGRGEPLPGASVDVRDDVLAEIEVLVELFRERPEAAERLSVVLERAPERLLQLLAREDGEEVLARVGGLLPRLGAGAFGLVVQAWAEGAPEVAARAERVLAAAAARLRTLPWLVGPDRTAGPEAYLLVDAALAAGAPLAERVRLLAELLAAARDGAAGDLIADALLAHGAPAAEALLRRWAAGPPDELPRPRAVLDALCRTGAPLARAIVDDLAGGGPAALRGLLAATALARHLRPEGASASPEARALEARHEHRVDRAAVGEPLRGALRRQVAARLGAADPRLREAALQAAAALEDRERIPAIRAALEAAEVPVRIAAAHALAALGDDASAPRLAARAAVGEPEERLAALTALGHLGPAAYATARDAVLALVDDPSEPVQAAAVGALAALGGDELEAVLRRLGAGGTLARRRAVARALHRGRAPPRPPSELSLRVRERLRGPGAAPVAAISVEATLRFALAELRPYEERELSRRIGRVCEDLSSVRRALVEQGLMTREEAVYRFTPLGEAAWRVERFVEAASGSPLRPRT